MIIDFVIVEIINENGCPLNEIGINMKEQGYENIWDGFLEEIRNRAIQNIVMEFIGKNLNSLNTSNTEKQK